MKRAGITAFASAMGKKIKELFGSTVTIAGTSYTAAVSTGAPTLNLDAGGFQQPVDYVVRVLKTDMPSAPAVKSLAVINSKNYRVLSVRQSFSPLAQEWIIEVATP